MTTLVNIERRIYDEAPETCVYEVRRAICWSVEFYCWHYSFVEAILSRVLYRRMMILFNNKDFMILLEIYMSVILGLCYVGPLILYLHCILFVETLSIYYVNGGRKIYDSSLRREVAYEHDP